MRSANRRAKLSQGPLPDPGGRVLRVHRPGIGLPQAGHKTKWRFTLAGEPWFCIAGLVRATPEGEAFTMLTVAPGPDVAPYHDRQIAVLRPTDWGAWLDLSRPEAEVLRAMPAGSLDVEQVSVGAGKKADSATVGNQQGSSDLLLVRRPVQFVLVRLDRLLHRVSTVGLTAPPKPHHLTLLMSQLLQALLPALLKNVGLAFQEAAFVRCEVSRRHLLLEPIVSQVCRKTWLSVVHGSGVPRRCSVGRLLISGLRLRRRCGDFLSASGATILQYSKHAEYIKGKHSHAYHN